MMIHGSGFMVNDEGLMINGSSTRQAAARHPEGWRLFHEAVSRKPSVECYSSS